MIRKCKLVLTAIVLIFSLGTIGVSAAEEDAWKDWSFYSPLQLEGSSKYKAVYLTEEVYEHSLPSLADLRLIDGNGNVVPYYIQYGQTVTEKNELVYQAKLVATAQKDNDTKLDFNIKPIRENSDIVGNMLLFSLPEQNFLKHIIIYGSFDGNHWEQVGKDFIYRTESLQKNRIPLVEAYKYSYYRVTILDNAEHITLPKLELIYQATNSQWKWYEKSTVLNYELTEEDKVTVIKLSNPQHLRIREIHFDVDGNFQRPYSLYDSNGRWIAADEVQELYNLHFKNIEISNTGILLDKSPLSTEQITIKIENRDNPPLNIQGITVNYYIDKIVFEDKGETPYRLYYGNQQVKQPQYDLKLFQSYIEKEKQDVVMLGKAVSMKPNQDTTGSELPGWLNLKIIFNIVVVLISLILIVLLVRKLNKQGSQL